MHQKLLVILPAETKAAVQASLMLMHLHHRDTPLNNYLTPCEKCFGGWRYTAIWCTSRNILNDYILLPAHNRRSWREYAISWSQETQKYLKEQLMAEAQLSCSFCCGTGLQDDTFNWFYRYSSTTSDRWGPTPFETIQGDGPEICLTEDIFAWSGLQDFGATNLLQVLTPNGYWHSLNTSYKDGESPNLKAGDLREYTHHRHVRWKNHLEALFNTYHASTAVKWVIEVS